MKHLERIESGLIWVEERLLTGLLLFLVALAFLQVALRGFLSYGILWGDTLGRHLVLWLGFLGAGLAASSDKQFAMDAASRALPGRWKPLSRLLCHVFTVAVCVFLCEAAVTFFLEEWKHSSVLFTAAGIQFPAWAFEIIVPLGFGLLALHYALKAWAAVLEMRRLVYRL